MAVGGEEYVPMAAEEGEWELPVAAEEDQGETTEEEEGGVPVATGENVDTGNKDEEDGAGGADEMYARHVRSWEAFEGILSEPLSELTTSLDESGFSKEALNSYSCNKIPLSSVSMPRVELPGEKPNNLKNLTSMAGCVYKILDSKGISMLPLSTDVSEFSLRLARTFSNTAARGAQLVAPLQLRLKDSALGSTKLESPVLAPHLDMDDEMFVSEAVARRHVDSEGYILESACEALHFNADQLGHRAAICAEVLAKRLDMDVSRIFCVVMKSRLPGMEMVRESRGSSWVFAPLVEEGGRVRVKTSYWVVFGLREALEMPVETFAGECDDENPDARNCARMMRKDASSVVDGPVRLRRFARGYGISMTHGELKKFRVECVGRLQADCRSRESSWAWALPHRAGSLPPENIKPDEGAQGMRPPGATKVWRCAYHRMYDPPEAPGRAHTLAAMFPGGCPARKLHGLCSENKKVKTKDSDPTASTRCPFPSGVHMTASGAEERDRWLLTARCNRVVRVAGGDGAKIVWAEKLLQHPNFGALFEASLTNLFVAGEVAAFADRIQVPGVYCDGEKVMDYPYTPLDPAPPQVRAPPPGPAPRACVPYQALKANLDLPAHCASVVPGGWEVNENTVSRWADSATPAASRVRASVRLLDFCEGDSQDAMTIENIVRRLIETSSVFKVMDPLTRREGRYSGSNLQLQIFVEREKAASSKRKRGSGPGGLSTLGGLGGPSGSGAGKKLRGIVACFGPPFACWNHGHSEAMRKERVKQWKLANPGRSGENYDETGLSPGCFMTTHTHADGAAKGSNCMVIRYDPETRSMRMNLSCLNPACRSGNAAYQTMGVPFCVDALLRVFEGLSSSGAPKGLGADVAVLKEDVGCASGDFGASRLSSGENRLNMILMSLQ